MVTVALEMHIIMQGGAICWQPVLVILSLSAGADHPERRVLVHLRFLLHLSALCCLPVLSPHWS